MTDENEEAVRQLWDRQEGEPNKWFRRFERFLAAGPNRKLLATVNEEKAEAGSFKRAAKTPGSWDRAAEAWNWRNRAEAYDEHVAEENRFKIEERYQYFREKEWEILEKALEKIEGMLHFPLQTIEQTVESEGGKVINHTTVMPARWSMRDAASMMEAMSRIADSFTRGAGHGQQEDGSPVNVNIDLSNLPKEILESIADDDEIEEQR